MIRIIYTLALIVLLTQCNRKSTSIKPSDNKELTYKETLEDFSNPERGFYIYSETKASNPQPLTAELLNSYKPSTQASNGNYAIFSTLIFRYYVLDIFKDKDIATSFLEGISEDFAIARQTGFKIIPRFTYTTKQTAGACPEGFICPPYGDAPKAIVLRHIEQLKQLFETNVDVIAAVQMGFIGVWGEQYYTDYFGDASQNAPTQKLLDPNWQDRIDVIRALLDAVPAERNIQVRYPQIKQRFTNGINADINTLPLKESEAFNESDKARLGYHNDCFLASENDYGTYEDYGNSSSPRKDANAVMRAFMKADSKFVAVGGETCDDAFSPQNDCEPAGRAQTEMAEMHYSYLNSAYNNKVNNDWQESGCMDSIKRNLGYRLVLKRASLPKVAKAGDSFSFSFTIENRGYASPFNKRPVKLILRNKQDSAEREILLSTDVRRWYSGSTVVEEQIAVPADLATGEYDLYLSLHDQSTNIQKRPEYAIRLANETIWDASKGYNKLDAVLKVN